MQKLVIAVAATAAVVVCGSACVAQAIPFAAFRGMPSPDSLIEKIGCTKGGDICPYGQRVVRHTGHGPSCEPCSSQKKESKAPPPSGPPARQSPDNEGYDRGHGGYAREHEGYERGHEGYDHEQGYDREQRYDRGQGYGRRDEGYDRGQGYGRRQGDDAGDEGYDRGDQGYDNRRYPREDDRDYSGGPPSGWRRYDERPYGWQERDCVQLSSLWYCRP